ncbi:CHAT domain-containing protein [Intrasporangium sp.]|uniref:CHAT domain-containing protein n=1 Tax=Intrasporangium sp. TaxID=1925024 RepID=UPI00293A228B|nr:CHAT domain-containing protein [Intrasporangium sp.]MDV3219936.1 CHAT domain-containing tetratricopeptide repeat protein [Intrasporangium sp.]
MAISQPTVALATATGIIATDTDARRLSIAHQAAAIVQRDRGRMDAALSHGLQALRFARRIDPERQGDVLATLAVVLFFAGRTAQALARFEEAVRLTPAAQLPRLFHRRGLVLWNLSRYTDALDDLSRAVDGSHRLGDILWEGRALNGRCTVHLSLGDVDAAQADAARAGELLTSVGQDYEAAQALHNQAVSAHQRGDLPQSLALWDRVTERYEALGNVSPELYIDHGHALLTAGLIDEAQRLCEAGLEKERSPVRRAELLLFLAQVALTRGDSESAESRADAAARLFRSQLRPGWVDRARLLRLRAQHLADHPELQPWSLEDRDRPERSRRAQAARNARLLRDAHELVESMRASHALELPVALVLQGRIANDSGDAELARSSLAAAALTRRSGPPLSRAAGWLAAALLASQDGDGRALYSACRRGLDAVDEHRAVLGDFELRALASGHGIELARLAVSAAVRAGRPRELWWWAERWRASALNAAFTRPDDPVLRTEVAALRDVTRRLDSLADDDPTGSNLLAERARLEASIRRAHRRLRAEGSEGFGLPPGLDLPTVMDELGDAVLLTFVNDRDDLHLVTVRDGRVRHHRIGSSSAAEREADFARFALRRAASGRLVDLTATAARLESALLGPHSSALRGLVEGGDRPAVVVPPAGLLTAPWGLLPLFAGVNLTVSPSVTQWLKARRALRTRANGHVALVTGPGLSTREAEVTRLSPVHRGALVLPAEKATVAAALEALDGAGLAHVAAHGTFRADAPLFSSLQLADGPLTVHDLEGLRHTPRSIILSACDSGGAAPIGPHEALGLVSALLGMGASDVLASVVPVNDHATLSVMADVHAVAGRGGTLSEGWLAARTAAQGDLLRAATAASFTSWGA